MQTMQTMLSRMDMPLYQCPRTKTGIKARQSIPLALNMGTAPHPLSTLAALVNMAVLAHPASTGTVTVPVLTSIKIKTRKGVAQVLRIRIGARAASIPVHLINLARTAVIKRAVPRIRVPAAVAKKKARAAIRMARASIARQAAINIVHPQAVTSIKMAAVQNIVPPLKNTKKRTRMMLKK